MYIKSLEITNFKCVSTCQKIEFRPITLLFGPNSAGKSTIIHALHYLREILTRENLNPDITIGGGELDLGGFRSLVHKHNLKESITFKVTVALSDELRRLYLPLNSGYAEIREELGKLDINYIHGLETTSDTINKVNEIGFEISISYNSSNGYNCPYVSKISTEMNGSYIASIFAYTSNKTTNLTDINLDHPLFAAFSPVPNEETQISPIVSIISKLIPVTYRVDDNGSMCDLSIEVHSTSALPQLTRMLEFDVGLGKDNMIEFESPQSSGLSELFDEMMLGPARIVKHCLNQTSFLGPLRKIPERNFKAQNMNTESRWVSGLGTWDLLNNDQLGKLTEKVNNWIADSNRLDTPYFIELESFKKTNVEINTNTEKNSEYKIGESNDAGESSLNSIVQREIVLKQRTDGTTVQPSDVGVGISQLIPVVVSTLSQDRKLLVIEQPELHLHPALQVRLGDLFIHGAKIKSEGESNGRCLIVETHSEHLLLRLLRRIRETNNGKLCEEAMELTPDDISVIYADTTSSKLIFRKLRVNEKGDFIDRWPHGYFDERGEELF